MNLKEVSTKDLTIRLNQIDKEKSKLEIEELTIMHELWDRIPGLKNDENLQSKVLNRTKKH